MNVAHTIEINISNETSSYSKSHTTEPLSQFSEVVRGMRSADNKDGGEVALAISLMWVGGVIWA